MCESNVILIQKYCELEHTEMMPKAPKLLTPVARMAASYLLHVDLCAYLCPHHVVLADLAGYVQCKLLMC